MRLSRPWLALVLVAFCLPLFVGLGRPDLETDEAIYSFAVDRMLEVGDWLEPKLSPFENEAFLEKPPLKFWMVAVPIRAGLLPHDEFGLRFWDAVAGSAAFCYVFAIGSLLAGPVCGAVAVLLLFIHFPLVMVHGLRTNNMEAALVLSYCAGVFHFLRWAAVDDHHRRTTHAVACGLFFVLGFMTKFVAALFLPVTVGLAAILSPDCRRRLIHDRATWVRVSALVVVLCAPWFVYAHLRFGARLWATILGEHVLKRMTSYLDPTHVHPWYFYAQEMWREFTRSGIQWLIVAGLVVLLTQTIRRRWFAGAVVLTWGLLPLLVISGGSSKLYHYAYPYLPPFALAAGYLISLVAMLAPVLLRRVLEQIEDFLATRWPRLVERARGSRVQRTAALVVAVATVVAIAGTALGGIRVVWNGTRLFKSSGAMRPALLILLVALATRTSTRASRLVVALVVFNALPLAAYRGQIDRLPDGLHPIRSAAECVQRVQAETAAKTGILIDIPEGTWHPLYYYFRRVRPVAYATTPLDPEIDRALAEPSAARPILMSDQVWSAYVAARRPPGTAAPTPPMMPFLTAILLLPGPYAACGPEAAVHSAR